ncbi:hypothetical protein [Psychromarinibacter halotolerans]|uniref:Uncharacterized protein n=2 Tax=Psychromarinibacter halotolerans TaxID=1775175 RepID=A0ABV7GRC6_9RHOB|nr:hypothetical protein [Psychromarinibacter halotolerans]MDF0594977.1 hypothetical protein [Psychromarinibacter halotolerans]
MSWEARLERARAQRESVLRAKAAEGNEPKPLVDKSALRPPDPSEPAEGNAPPTTPADMFVFGPAPENPKAPKADPAAKPEPASKAAGTAGPPQKPETPEALEADAKPGPAKTPRPGAKTASASASAKPRQAPPSRPAGPRAASVLKKPSPAPRAASPDPTSNSEAPLGAMLASGALSPDRKKSENRIQKLPPVILAPERRPRSRRRRAVTVALGFCAGVGVGVGVGALTVMLRTTGPGDELLAVDQPDAVVAEPPAAPDNVPAVTPETDVADAPTDTPGATPDNVLTNIQPTSTFVSPSQPGPETTADLPGTNLPGSPVQPLELVAPDLPTADPAPEIPEQPSATDLAAAEAPAPADTPTEGPDALAVLDGGPLTPEPDIQPAPPAPTSASVPPPARPGDLSVPAPAQRPEVGPAHLRPETFAMAEPPAVRPPEGAPSPSDHPAPFTDDAAPEENLRALGRPDDLTAAATPGALPGLDAPAPPPEVFAWASPPSLDTPGTRPAPMLASAPADPPFRSALVLLGATGTSGMAPATDPVPPTPIVPGLGNLAVWIFAEPSVDAQMVQTTTRIVEDLGLPVRRVMRVDYQISENQVRFYDTWAAEGAGLLADGLHAAARDFVSSGYNPDGGVLEIYLANEDSVYPPFRRDGATGATVVQPETVEEKLRDSLLSKLRDG